MASLRRPSSSLRHLEQPIIIPPLGVPKRERGLPQQTYLSAVGPLFWAGLQGGVDPGALEEPRDLALGIRYHSAKDDVTIIEGATLQTTTYLSILYCNMGESYTNLHTMETSFPRGTVRYMEVGLSSGAQANSARLSEGTRMPSRRLGPWQTGSTGRGTLLWESHRRRLRRRQSQDHLQHS